MINLSKKKWFIAISILVWVFLVLMIASQNSFLYKMNDWCDVNIYLSVAKMMKSGKVLYRDIFEQKGPYLYFLHYLTLFISHKTYFGVFVMEYIFGVLVAIYAYRILALFIESPARRLLWLALFLTGYYMSPAFAQGDSAEEMVMPLFMITLFYGVAAMKKEKSMPWYQMLLIGLFCGIAILIKFTLVGIFCGTALIVFIFDIRDKKPWVAVSRVPLFFLGVALAFVVPLIYFKINNATEDLFKVYFYDNLFLYSKTSNTTPLRNNSIPMKILCMFLGYTISIFCIYPTSITLIIALVIIVREKRYKTRLFMFLFVSYVSMVFCIYITGKIFVYYGLPMAIYMLMGLVVIDEKWDSYEKGNQLMRKLGKGFVPVYLTTLLLSVFLLNEYIFKVFQPKSAYYQFAMADIIDEYEEKSNQDATLLNYGFLDSGLYYVSDTTPTCKYFCTINMNYQEMFDIQEGLIQNGEVTFVVTRNKELDEKFDKYTLVYHQNAMYEFLHYDYYLYQLTDTL